MKHCEGCYGCITPCGREERLFDMKKSIEDTTRVKLFEKYFISMDDDGTIQVDDKYLTHFEGTDEEKENALSEEIHYVVKLLLSERGESDA
jgi:hypothetical protein